MMFETDIPSIVRPIRTALHYRGLFSELVSNYFDFPSFRNLIKPEAFHSDNGTVWSMFIENIDMKLPCELDFQDKADLPIDSNLKIALYLLASKIIIGKANWNVGIFWSRGKMATLGNHFDDDEVYTIQLCGSKEWILDCQDIERLNSLIGFKMVKPISSPETFSSSETWVKAHGHDELTFRNPTAFVVKPGDLLVTPAYALHNVRSLSCNSVSLNIGICRKGALSGTELLYVQR